MPDSTKVKAINEMPNPTDKTGVMRFLGMVNYLSSYIIINYLKLCLQ
jgi:hypothetical protein